MTNVFGKAKGTVFLIPSTLFLILTFPALVPCLQRSERNRFSYSFYFIPYSELFPASCLLSSCHLPPDTWHLLSNFPTFQLSNSKSKPFERQACFIDVRICANKTGQQQQNQARRLTEK
ncbi:MAG: hypothetical protein RB296_01980 [Acidobacteriota bacterium]|jgi:hypothetical protein|nr:hypothetical protein [Acidobacteriota bacterium]